MKRKAALDARSVKFRGNVLDARQVERIGELVKLGRGQSRQELARAVCRRFGWRRANGALAIRSARDLLVGLDEKGVIELPAPRRRQGRPDPEVVQAAAALLGGAGREQRAQGSAPVQGGGSALQVRLIESAELLGWRAHMERFHYLADGALIGESLRYVAVEGGRWVALLGWAAASLHNAARDRYVGWDGEARRANLPLVVNNSRFLVLPWGRRPNLASQVLAANLRRLSRDWEAHYGHRVVLAESFVDSARFRGTCYLASNWRCVGQTRGWSKKGQSYRFHGEVKAVWLYALRRDFKAQLCSVEARPSKEKFVMVDVQRLPLEGEGGLFEILSAVPDPRKRRGVRHQIQSILATALCAVLGGARSITAMAEWAAEQSPHTLRRLGSSRGKPPSERTYRRTFAAIDIEAVDRLIGGWMAGQEQSLATRALAIDGKTVRGSADKDKSALHLLSAIVHDSATVVAQVPVSSKTNEITRVQPLFEELNIEGAVVTADALLTQKKIAEHLVKDKHADYVFVVKDNQLTLRQDIATLGFGAFPPSVRNAR